LQFSSWDDSDAPYLAVEALVCLKSR